MSMIQDDANNVDEPCKPLKVVIHTWYNHKLYSIICIGFSTVIC